MIACQLGRRISEPLLDVAEVAHRLREGDLSARAEVTGTAETEELAAALNGLADRTGELLLAERAAVADLSHRLRTPVTALRLDAEAVSEPELAERLGDHIGVLQRSIDAIVHEARRPVRRDLRETCDAAEVVRERVRFWQALAEDQGRAVDVSVPDRVMTVPLAAEDLADLVDVLVDNVFAHTPEGTPFAVLLSGAGEVARLEVRRRGAGPAPRRPRPPSGHDRPRARHRAAYRPRRRRLAHPRAAHAPRDPGRAEPAAGPADRADAPVSDRCGSASTYACRRRHRRSRCVRTGAGVGPGVRVRVGVGAGVVVAVVVVVVVGRCRGRCRRRGPRGGASSSCGPLFDDRPGATGPEEEPPDEPGTATVRTTSVTHLRPSSTAGLRHLANLAFCLPCWAGLLGRVDDQRTRAARRRRCSTAARPGRPRRRRARRPSGPRGT